MKPKIGIDLHGTIDYSPELAGAFMKMLMDLGFDISVISGPPKRKIQIELSSLNIRENVHYKNIFSIIDYLKDKKCPMWQDDNGNWWADDKTWWSSKNDICNEYNITILIDNEQRYVPYMDKKIKFYGVWSMENFI